MSSSAPSPAGPSSSSKRTPSSTAPRTPLASSSKVSLQKGPLYAKIQSVVSPSIFWATEIPYHVLDPKTGIVDPETGLVDGRKGLAQTDLGKVLKLEMDMAKRYNVPHDKLKILADGQFEQNEVKEGDLVAVRCHALKPEWYRARVISVYSRVNVDLGGSSSAPENFIKVFLIDYGRYLECNVRVNVRRLSRPHQLFPAPLAFQLVLAGVRPITWEVNYDIGMKTMAAVVTAKEWSEKAYEAVKEVLSLSPTKLVEVTDWQKDYRGRLHGHVKMFKFPHETRLDEVLKNGGFAMQDEQTFYSDLLAKPPGPRMEGRMLSICGWGPSSKPRTWDDIPDSTLEDFGGGSSRGGAGDGKLDESAVSTATTGSKKIGGHWLSVPRKKSLAPSSEASENAEVGAAAAATAPVTSLRGLLLAKRAGPKVESDSGSFWDKFKEPAGSSAVSAQPSRRNVIVMPAGVDPGKFHEELLKRVKSDGIGPKKLSNLFKEEGEEEKKKEVEKEEEEWQ